MLPKSDLRKKKEKKNKSPWQRVRERQESKLRQCLQAGGLPTPGAGLSSKHRGFFVRKQEQGLILAGRALLKEVGGLPVSRPHFPYAGVFVGIVCLLIKGSVCAFGGGTLAPNIILSRGLPHSATTGRIN